MQPGKRSGSDPSDRQRTDLAAVDGLIPPGAYLGVVCPVCDTRMYATRAQVGTKIICPDCHTATVVSPPRPPPQRKPRPPEEDDDPLEVEDAVSGADLDLPDVHIPVLCPICDTRMLAARSQLGTKIVCRDCRTTTVVPAPPPPKAKPQVPEDDDPLLLEVCAPIERPPVPIVGHVSSRDQDEHGNRAAAGPGRGTHGHDDRAPRYTFVAGILDFPLRPGNWQRWLALSVGLLFVRILLAEAVALGRGGASKEWALCLLFTILAFVAALIWSIVASVSCLAILQGTADGSEDIGWPDALWIDWVLDSLYVVNALAVTSLFGFGISRLLDRADWTHALSLPVTVFILFPIVLLSMLEAVSPFSPCSLPVLRCLLSGWWAWSVVYLETGVLIAVATWLAHQCVTLGGVTDMIALPPLIVATFMVYFRLWGRLAWYCTKITARRTAAEDDENELSAT